MSRTLLQYKHIVSTLGIEGKDFRAVSATIKNSKDKYKKLFDTTDIVEGVTDSITERCYIVLNGITEKPKYKDGKFKKFISFKNGYDTENYSDGDMVNACHKYITKSPHAVKSFFTQNPNILKELYEKTDHIVGISSRIAHRMYHIVNGGDSIPKNEYGGYMWFKNNDEGYSTSCKTMFYKYTDNDIANITDYNFWVNVAKFHNISNMYNKFNNVKNLVNSHTAFLPDDCDLNVRIHYFKCKLQSIHKCTHCGNALTRHFNVKKGSFKCSNICDEIGELDYNDHDAIIKVVKKFAGCGSVSKYNKFLNKSLHVKEFLLNSEYCPEELKHNEDLAQISFHVMYKNKDIPKCAVCSKKLNYRFNYSTNVYYATCSRACDVNFIDKYEHDVAEKYNYGPATGSNENEILTVAGMHWNFRYDKYATHTVGKYFPDFVNDNVIYEVFEKYHLNNAVNLKDIKRMYSLINLGFNIRIIWDNIYTTSIKNVCNKIKKALGDNVEIYLYYSDKGIIEEYKGYDKRFKIPCKKTQRVDIQTHRGFKAFEGLRKIKTDERVYTLTTNSGNSYKFTENHILLDDNGKEILVKDIVTGQKLANHNTLVSNIIETDYGDYVYDLLDVDTKEHSYILNNEIVSHNCNILILDECLLADEKITVQSIETGEIREVGIGYIYEDDKYN